MKLKLTINFKNGNRIKMIKNIGEPPKGTDKDTHYLLSSHEMVDSVLKNGLNVYIPPTQIDKVFIQPKKSGDKHHGKSALHKTAESRQAL